MQTIKIDELKPHPRNDELPTLSADERTGLKRLIEMHGFTEAIEITKAHVILDGHNRTEIAKELGMTELPYRIIDVPEEEELNYIIDKNSGRRQMTAKKIAYLRGKLYLHVKGEGDGKKSEQIAKEDGVSEKTVRRDAKFSEELDEATKTAPAVKDKILNNEIKATKEDVKKVANLPENQQREVLAKAEESGDVGTAYEELHGKGLQHEEDAPSWQAEELKISTSDKIRKVEGVLIRKVKELEKQKKIHAAFDAFINKIGKLIAE